MKDLIVIKGQSPSEKTNFTAKQVYFLRVQPGFHATHFVNGMEHVLDENDRNVM